MLMDFEAAMKVSKAFSEFNPRIFKQFSGFPLFFSLEAESGYVVFVDASVANDSRFGELKDFVVAAHLTIASFRGHLLVCD